MTLPQNVDAANIDLKLEMDGCTDLCPTVRLYLVELFNVTPTLTRIAALPPQD